jgi:hypothetical protein
MLKSLAKHARMIEVVLIFNLSGLRHDFKMADLDQRVVFLIHLILPKSQKNSTENSVDLAG